MFKLVSKFKPAGDQPEAITRLVKNLKNKTGHQVLLGVTGSGKTYTCANVIKQAQRPALWISHNKTLAAQTYQEFKEFFPENAVHYFVSYYDYYQPEAYIPQTDTYIAKDAKVNEEIDRLRHAAVQDLMTRKDIIIIASVSCIYNIGSPKDYQKVSLEIKTGQKIKRKELVSYLISLQYKRNDNDFGPRSFRIRGDIIEIFSVTGNEIFKVEFNNDRIETLSKKTADEKKSEFSSSNLSFLNKENKKEIKISSLKICPANFWVAPQEKLKISVENIKLELQQQLIKLKNKKQLLEAQRLEQKTNYDLEMLKESGWCHGVENYSRHLEFRKPGDPPYALLDYYPKDFLTFIDESHMTIPQIKAMAVQDRARKKILIEHGFRLPSSIDNRPLTLEEFEKKTGQKIYVSATPEKYEIQKSKNFIAEQLIRPTGLLEPSIEIRQTENQIKDLIEEIKKRTEKKFNKEKLSGPILQQIKTYNTGQKILVLTLTKRLAEAVSDHLTDKGIKNQWLHSEIKTLERPQIIKDLREGKYDVLIGINLLREGLDLPEVSLVAILDADKEGFLRSKTTLIQTMGRAARHNKGHVILYADRITKSIKAATDEIKRRRQIQEKYNKKHKIIPRQIIKEIRSWNFATKKKEITSEFWIIKDKILLEKEMKEAARNLNFERAAEIRDLIKKLKS